MLYLLSYLSKRLCLSGASNRGYSARSLDSVRPSDVVKDTRTKAAVRVRAGWQFHVLNVAKFTTNAATLKRTEFALRVLGMGTSRKSRLLHVMFRGLDFGRLLLGETHEFVDAGGTAELV